MALRATSEEAVRISRAAGRLKVTRSRFLRWAAVRGTEELEAAAEASTGQLDG